MYQRIFNVCCKCFVQQGEGNMGYKLVRVNRGEGEVESGNSWELSSATLSDVYIVVQEAVANPSAVLLSWTVRN